jgi:agmatinase
MLDRVGGERLVFLGPEADVPFERARVAVLPVPFEASVSYGRGTRRGPEAVLRASAQVELYDEQLGIEPYRSGIWTEPALVVPPGPMERALDLIGRRFGELLDAGKWVVMLGGEHSITPAGVRALAARRPGLHVLQLDAHADLRSAYEGNPWSHACAMARCLEHAPVRAVGVRSYSAEEAAAIRAGIACYSVVHAWEMDRPGWVERALAGLGGQPVYLTIDVDYFDPAVIPSTGTPEPGGGRWWQTLDLLDALFRRSDVVACDVVELAPAEGLHHADFAVARLVHKLVGLKARSGLRG